MSDQFSLPAELTIYTAAESRLQCMASLDNADLHDAAPATPWRIDASAVADIDASGLQLLLSLQKALAATGRTLELTDSSAALTSACTALGVQCLATLPKA